MPPSLTKKEKRFAAVMLVSLLAIIAFSNTTLSQTQTANLAAQIPFQGKLSDSFGKALTGNFNFKFEIYDSQTAGAKLWGEEQIISVSNGRYQAYLGKISALTSSLAVDKLLYLQVGVKTPAEASYKTLSPRISLSPNFAKVFSAGSADNSKSADSISGNLDASKISSQILDSQIKDINARKISGQVNDSQISDVAAAKISTGALDSARIPSLDAGKITTGIFSINQIPSIGDSKITDVGAGKISGTFDVGKITGSFDGRLSYKVSGGSATASDNSVISFSTKTYGVDSFGTNPKIVCSTESNLYFCNAVCGADCKSGFTLRITKWDGGPGSGIPVNWIAIGS